MIIMIKDFPFELEDIYKTIDDIDDAAVVELNKLFGELVVPNITKFAGSLQDAFELANSIRPDTATVLILESLRHTSTSTSDPVETEALSIASEMIQTRLSASNLPVPQNLETHARELLAARPSIRTTALKRLQAKARTKSRIFEDLGMNQT